MRGVIVRIPSLRLPVPPRVIRVAEFLLVTLMRYEDEAITNKNVPTVSSLCRARRPVEAVLLAILLAHLHIEVVEETASGPTKRPSARPVTRTSARYDL